MPTAHQMLQDDPEYNLMLETFVVELNMMQCTIHGEKGKCYAEKGEIKIIGCCPLSISAMNMMYNELMEKHIRESSHLFGKPPALPNDLSDDL